MRFALLALLFPALVAAAEPQSWAALEEANRPEAGEKTIAIVGATLIDGRGGYPVRNATVIVEGDRIRAAGPDATLTIPPGAELVDAHDLYLLPGMLDAHFHTHDKQRLDRLLAHGFTAARDPGRPLPVYLDDFFDPKRPLPRTFLTGPHFDQKPHAHPHNAVDLQTAQAVRNRIDQLVAQGASAIKIYYRLPLELIRAACERADSYRIPVTAHLELVRADDAIRAGLDGIEHTTSLGTALASETDGRAFERSVEADNEARRQGRYRLWSRIDLDGNPKVDALIELMLEHGVYLVPTLRPFEPVGEDANYESRTGFAKMQQFTRMAFEAGVPVIASSHGPTPEGNWREFELRGDAGLSEKDALHTALLPAAQFFGAAERLGSIEAGKAADLVLLRADPLQDINAVREVEKVMLNGVWVETEP